MPDIDLQLDRLDERITAHELALQQGVHEIGGPFTGAGWFVFDAVNTIKSDSSGSVLKGSADLKIDQDNNDWRVLFHCQRGLLNCQAAFFTWNSLAKIAGTWDEFDEFDVNIELYVHARNITTDYDPDTVNYSNKPSTGSEFISASKFAVLVGGISPQGGDATYEHDAAKFEDVGTPIWYAPLGTTFDSAGRTYGIEVRLTAQVFGQEGGTWEATGSLKTDLVDSSTGLPIHAAIQY